MYMTVSGAPVKKLCHAEPMSAMALDTIEAVKSIKNPANRKPMTVTIGKKFFFLAMNFDTIKSARTARYYC